MTDAPLDRRLSAFRPDLADARLKGRVAADRYVDGAAMETVWPSTPLHGGPNGREEVGATLLRGEPVRVFEVRDGWAWVQSDRDGYVGYASPAAFAARGAEPSDRVVIPRAPLRARPSVRAPVVDWAPMGAVLRRDGVANEHGFVRLDDGSWSPAAALVAVETRIEDWVGVGERLLGAPYVWGGETVEGVDCSGLIQVALEAARGASIPRDSDLQRALGSEIPDDAPLRRGDLVFWRGHVGAMLDGDTLLHANAHHMRVAVEPLAEAVARIAAAEFGPVIARRRLE